MNQLAVLKDKGRFLSVAILSLLAYIAITYYTPRQYFGQFIGLYFLLFWMYFGVVWGAKQSKTEGQVFGLSIHYYLGLAILLRLSLLLLLPNLTDDYFRYIWDGRLLNHGINPFMYLPNELLNEPIYQAANLDQLYDGLNSPKYFSVYPPVGQLFFYISAWCFPDDIMGSIIVMRSFYILFEIGSIFLILRLLKLWGKPSQWVLIYALNPLIIIEFTGNLHQEILMIFFMLASIYTFAKERFFIAAFCLAAAINAKLIPMAFAPLFFFYLLRNYNLIKALQFTLYTVVCFALPYIPFLSWTLIEKIGSSVGLYFGNFEFNGSVFYLLKRGVVAWFGYNQTYINIITVILPLSSLVFILWTWYRSYFYQRVEHIFTGILGIVSVYYLIATTVHPWYISTLIMAVAFLPLTYPLVWSCLIAMSYITYQTTDYIENYYLIALEYLIVYGWLIYEWKKGKIKQLIKKTS